MFESNCLTLLPWETRNLGVPSYAISDSFLESFDEKTLSVEIETLFRQKGPLFIQTRINKTQLQIVPSLQRLGFIYTEVALAPMTFLRENKILEKFKNDPGVFIPDNYPHQEVRFYQIERSDEISLRMVRSLAVDAFVDDRFHLDPKCPPQTADERFVHWVNDLAADSSAIFYILSLKNTPVGFMIRKKENVVLTGFGKKHGVSGLGEFLWLSTLLEMLKEGYLEGHTMISVNNTRALNLCARMDFTFRNPCVTFHFWKKK